MKFTLSINCDNAAFEDNPASEIEHILCDVARQIHDSDVANKREDRGALRDSNGNTVGTWRYVAE